MRILAILTLRNEASFLLEWLAHHMACGFTDFLVFSNDCTDGTDAMLDRLQAMGALTHVRNDGPHDEGPQWAALKAADRHPLARAADWIAVLDIDEFVNIHVGDHRLGALLSALPPADAIALTWRMFGNDGQDGYDGAPVTETFTRAAPAVLHWPWRAQLFKTLFRNDGTFRKLGVHRPRSPAPGRAARWVDGSGTPLPDAAQANRILTPLGRDAGRIVQLNHYALGWRDTYLVKCDRGRANREGSTFDAGYWIDRNFTAVEDRTILALDSTALRQDLMADAVLGPLHRDGVAWRQARFATLMREEAWRALYGRLLLAGPSRLLTAEEARQIWRHGQARAG